MTNTHPHDLVSSGPSARAGGGRRRRLRLRRGALTAGALLAAVATASLTAGPAALAASPSPSPSPGTTPTTGGTLAPAGQIKWSISPSSTTGPDQRLKFSYTNIEPGATVSDHLAVLNYSRQQVDFEIYGTDATGTTAQNSLQLMPAGQKPTDIGSWVTVGGHAGLLSVIIPAGQGVVEPFSVNVPRQATPGDHTGGLIASVSLPEAKGKGAVVYQDVRIAVPLELRVIGPLHAGLSVESISGTFHNSVNPFATGSATVSFFLHNTGNVRLAGQQTAWVTGLLGTSVKVKLPAMPTVLPGDSVEISGKARGLYPAGPFTAHVVVTPTAPAGAVALTKPLGTATGTASLFAVPWAAIVVLLLIAGVIVGLWQWIRYRRRALQERINQVADSVRNETENRLAAGTDKSAGGTPGKV
jgi:hypothetical protein